MVLVASALVACGDDTSTTAGTGGAGGDATATTTAGPTSSSVSSGNPTSSSVSSGNPTSSSTSSSSDGGGGNGQGGDTTTSANGGNGQGGDNGCTDIEFVDMAYAGDGAYVGSLDPELGSADLADFGVVYFAHVAGEIDLADADPATDAVFAGEDFEDGVGYTAVYLAESGTLTVAEGGWSFENVTVREINLEDGTFVAGGTCYNVADVSGDLGQPLIPAEWTCDPGFFAANDGCDCVCGAYDPDCDVPGTTYGCEQDPAGAYCGADALCSNVPVWWECDADQLGDGTTCDCDCGGPDPDCDGQNPVEGCDPGQTCGSAGVCLDPEAICNDLIDNDEDNSLDCGDSSCFGDADCIPGATPRDGTCDANTDCVSLVGADPLCVTPDLGVREAFCSEWCNTTVNDCGLGAICLDIGLNEGLCLTSCTEAGNECADGFDCVDLDGAGTFGCLPGVPDGWTCDATYYGAGDGCDCGCGVVDPDCADMAVGSCDFCDDAGSCSADACPGDIDANDNSTCG